MHARTVTKGDGRRAVSLSALAAVAAAIARNIKARELRGRLFSDFRGYLA